MAALGKLPLLFACIIIVLLGKSVASRDEFHEELFVKPLQNGHVYSHFQFTTAWDVRLGDKAAFQDYHLFPKALGEVLDKYLVQELHLTLTQGLWRHSKWGYPIVDAPPGAEVWAWFQEGTLQVDKTWTELINVLSGMFCASLNFMDTTSTVTPQLTFRPQGIVSDIYKRQADHLTRYAALPREAICTENLTPWKKLLPCGTQVGLASLLNAFKLYDATYSSLGLHVRPVCKNDSCTETSVELSLNVGVVFEPATEGGSGGKQDWTLKKLFARTLTSTCAVASSSQVSVDITSNQTSSLFTLTPDPTSMITVTRGQHRSTYAVYNIADYTAGGQALSLSAKYGAPVQYQQVEPPVFHASQFQTGYGQDKGGVLCLLHNHHPTKHLPVVFMEVVPWFLRVYLHTLTIETFVGRNPEIGLKGVKLNPDYMHYVPGRDRQRPYHLELVLNLPPNSVTRLSFEFERALLKWTEYPPDANHGFYINSAVVSAVLTEGAHYTAPPQQSARISAALSENQTGPFFVRLHTESLLVSLPTPDFSMPYNVICLACTVVAIAFGSIHNLTTRRFVVKDPTKKTGLISKLKAKLSWRKADPSMEETPMDKMNKSTENDEGDKGAGDTINDKGVESDSKETEGNVTVKSRKS